MKTILHTVDIKGTAKQVYHALATEMGLSGWWTTKVKVKGGEGGVVDFTFGGDFNPDMEITQLKDGRLVAWKCVSGHEPWADNTFSFRLDPRPKGCVLFFRQEYARELDEETYGRYNFNWGYYLESLRLLVETGQGKPYQA